jgi:hypothetical protein
MPVLADVAPAFVEMPRTVLLARGGGVAHVARMNRERATLRRPLLERTRI